MTQPRCITEYPELGALFNRHAELLQAALKDIFVGYYLQGSLATGGFDQTSDVDFVVVTRNELNEKEVELAQAVHDQIYRLETKYAKHLEYSFFPLAILRGLSSPFDENGVNPSNEKLWYFDNGSETIEKADHDNTLVVRWTLHNCGITIAGPPINSITIPVVPDDLRREIRNTMIGWGRMILEKPENTYNRFYQSYLVLNYCRMLHNLHTGTIDSKLNGLNWGKNNLDKEWIELLDFAWNERQDPDISIRQPGDRERYAQSLDFVKYTISLAKAFVI